MPRGDGTGPQGQGPMTGRGMGPCAGYDDQYPPRRPRLGRGLGLGLGRGLGRGLGFGRGPGRGLGRGLGVGRGGRGYGSPLNSPGGWWGPGVAPQDTETLGADEEKTLLKNESRRLKSVLKDIDKRLEQLDSDNK